MAGFQLTLYGRFWVTPEDQYADVNENDMHILGHFVLGTWFSDCMSDAPCLFVVAPHAAAEAHILFLLLSCLCRHAMLLGEFTRSIVASLLVPFLQPTLLIDQPDLSRSALRQLRATNTRGRHVSHKGQLLDLFCAKAVHSRNSLQMGSEYGSIQITVSPSIKSLSRFDLPTQELIANQFQSKLLMYRLRNFHTIKQSTFDVEGFTLPTRTTVRSLAACIVGDTELQSAVIRLFEGQDAMCRVDRSTQIKAVVVEAILNLWHTEQPKKLLVGEITVAANTILKGRAETVELQAREIGEELRDLGFHPDTRCRFKRSMQHHLV
jgi:hypothetical protein